MSSEIRTWLKAWSAAHKFRCIEHPDRYELVYLGTGPVNNVPDTMRFAFDLARAFPSLESNQLVQRVEFESAKTWSTLTFEDAEINMHICVFKRPQIRG